ncbi:Remorin [Carex littledalei]|uniref:Remorin n=1 Tax=Carex littledalei TaxID=544730 RepID=A0A833VJJ1_9POAL|nr:Remorin [Carex littledalei]
MLSDERAQNRAGSAEGFRDIHLITPPPTRRSNWPPSPRSRHTSTVSFGSGVDPAVLAEQLMTVNRELAMIQRGENNGNSAHDDLEHGRIIGDDDGFEDMNPLALVPESNPIPSPENTNTSGEVAGNAPGAEEEVSVGRVRREETEVKIKAWQTAEVAKINNRFKCEEVVINGWENAQVEKATARLKKIERKLEKERARAMEETQNEVARAHRKGEEKRASAEAKRGTKISKILDMAHFMHAVGRAPSKRSVF